MTTLDDLRRALETHAADAPDGAGLVQAAQVRAVRLRRRRRITGTAAVAGLVAAIALVTPIALQRQAAPRPVGPVRPAPAQRGPGDMTVTVDPQLGIPVIQRRAVAHQQSLTLLEQGPDKKPKFQAVVEAYDPGSGTVPFVPPTAEKTTISGQNAVYFVKGTGRTIATAQPTMEWTVRSGVTLTVSQVAGPADRGRLTATANALRVVAPQPVTTPFQLGPLPDGLNLTSVNVQQDFLNNGVYASATLSLPPTTTTPGGPIDAYEIRAFPKGPDWPSAGVSLTRTAAVAGHPAYYDVYHDNRGALTVDAGSCWVQFIKVASVSKAEQRALAAATRYGSCTDGSHWTPPVTAPAATRSVQPADRAAGEMTLTMDPALGARVDSAGASGSGQGLRLSFGSGENLYQADVYAYDPSVPSHRIVPGHAIESVVVQGRAAEYQFLSRSELLVWQDASGILITVEHHLPRKPPNAGSSYPEPEPDRARLVRVADAVRLGQARPLTAPIQLASLPDGSQLSGLTDYRSDGFALDAAITLAFPESSVSDKRQVDINASGEPPVPPERSGLRAVAPIKGHPAWYGGLNQRRNQLLVQAEGCWFQFITSPGMTEAQIRALAGGATYHRCDNHAEWVPPVR